MIDRSICAKSISIPSNRRIIAISDIHANLHIFQKLLKQIQFDSTLDELFLVGDLLEKGQQNMETLSYLMKLSQDSHVHLMLGNCDFVCKNILYEYRLDFLHEVLCQRQNSLIHEMAACMHEKITKDTDMVRLARKLKSTFRKELTFIADLPHVIETQDYIFAHAAILNEQTYGNEMRDIMRHDRFFLKNIAFHKYVIVGHIPVSEYCSTICDFNPQIDQRKHIIAIDGGNAVKRAGQLNALILHHGQFSFAHCDDLPEGIILPNYTPKQKDSIYITWHERAVHVLKEEKNQAYCQQIATGRRLWIPKAFLYEENGNFSAENYTNYLLPVRHGETVKIISLYEHYALVKSHGIMGWIPRSILKQ